MGIVEDCSGTTVELETPDDQDDEDGEADPGELPCRVQDSELWFGGTPEDLERAKVFCRDCPMRAECLDGALERREPWGVWGGEIFHRGRVIARKLPRGRPPRSGNALRYDVSRIRARSRRT